MSAFRPKPDDRTDNVEKLRDAIENTKENIQDANETLHFSSTVQKMAIKAKNERRNDSIATMEAEMKDEQAARENGYRDENQGDNQFV